MDNKNLKLALCVGIPAAIVAAVVVIFCLNLGGGSKGYMKVIPSSSVVVAKGNIGAVLQKSEALENENVSQLFNSAMEYVPEEYTLIFGHTPTLNFKEVFPLEVFLGDNAIGIDCGSGFGDGRLACVRLDDMKIFYSCEEGEINE